MNYLRPLAGLILLPVAAAALSPKAAAQEAPAVNYTYHATVVRVLDGATVALDVDLGFGVWLHNKVFALQGVSAPSIDGPDKAEALKRKTKAQAILPQGAEIVLQSIKDKNDKSGTYRAVLWKDGENLNARLSQDAK